MNYRPRITSEAQRDFYRIYDNIVERSESGAASWANAFYEALKTLERDPHRGFAPESQQYDEEIRQLLFKTRAGRTYRALFVMRGEEVLILHIRGPGQDLMTTDELVLPESDE
jgi:plasmid stabilization system protein ParE